MPKVAMCKCGEPLVCTFVFPKVEFVCIKCGNKYGWLGPNSADETPELLEKCESYKKEWQEITEGYMPLGSHVMSCELCKTSSDYSHSDHASAEEQKAHEDAVKRINDWRSNVTATAA